LNEEVKDWKIETIDDYYKLEEPNYPDVPKLKPNEVSFFYKY
jgi:hypothetical protein